MTGLREYLHEEILNQEEEERVTRYIIMTDKIDEIVRDIRFGADIGVSDGSYKDTFGTKA